jgi:hypothetical protein
VEGRAAGQAEVGMDMKDGNEAQDEVDEYKEDSKPRPASSVAS